MSPKDNNKQVSAAVRILHQKRDASARATHLMVKNDSLTTYEKAFEGQAAVKKFFIATFLERKKMSTKTSFKRIALVAASALAFGGVSVITATSANAATTTVTPSTTPSVTTVTATTGTYEIITISARVADKYYTITNTGGTVLYPATASDTTTAISTSATSTLWYSGATPGAAVFGGSDGDKTLSFSATSATAGTQTITIVGNTSTGTKTVVITWGASAKFSTTNSWSYITDEADDTMTSANVDTQGAAAKAAATNDVIVASKGVAIVGTIYVRALNDVSTGTAIASGSFTATVTGSGLVTGNASSGADMATAGLRAATSYPSATGYAAFFVYGDNTSGTGSIAITYTDSKSVTYTVATKTLIFAGTTPATMTTTQSGYVAATAAGVLGANNSSDVGAGAITASLKDSNGNAVAGKGSTIGSTVSAGWYLTSSNTACITTTLADANVTDGTVTTADGVSNLVGTYNLSVTAAAAATSGCTSDVTANYYVDASKTVSGTPIKFTVGAAKITTLAMTTDASTYTPGQKVTVTLTAKDSLGNKVADGYYGIFYDKDALDLVTTVNPFVLSASTTNLPFTLSGTAGAGAGDYTYLIQDGVVTSTFYAPYTDGAVSLNATLASTNAGSAPSKLASTLYGSKLTGEITVETGSNATSSLALDAANAATDAANNAYDEAQNATQAASDALAAVTELAAQVTSLIASVKKLTAAVAKLSKKK